MHSASHSKDNSTTQNYLQSSVFADGLSLVLHHMDEDGHPIAAEFHITVLITFKELDSKIQ